MLVCSKCGTAVRMAGHACPKCGNRGAVLDRVYKGAPRESAESPATVQVEPAEPPEPVLPEASASGGLPDAQRAWSPWLAVVVGVLFGPAAAVLVAGRNLARFRPGAPDPWLAMICVAVLQLGTGLLAGWIARSSMGYALGLWGGVWLLVLAITVRWQWRPVAAQRQLHPGRHTPGADAFGAFLAAALIGLVLFFGTFRLADRVSHGVLQKALDTLKPAPAPLAMPEMQGMPPM